jgi:hypothetical protein
MTILDVICSLWNLDAGATASNFTRMNSEVG